MSSDVKSLYSSFFRRRAHLQNNLILALHVSNQDFHHNELPSWIFNQKQKNSSLVHFRLNPYLISVIFDILCIRYVMNYQGFQWHTYITSKLC